jgi:hypothetical protein
MKLINLGIASIVATLAAFAANPAKAAVIDFESGFSDGDSVGTVTGSDGNQAIFSVGRSVNNRRDAEIAEKGGRFFRGTTTAFLPRDGARTSYSNQIGDFVLTDGIGRRNNYYIQFSKAVSSLSFDFLDLGRGLNSTLTAYSDRNFTNVISQTNFTGRSTFFRSQLNNVALDNLDPALSFSVSYRGDLGTAIDNINYDTVPEPLTIFGTVIAAGFGVAMKRKRQAA